MTLPRDIDSREFQKFKESTSVANQPSVVVINPDGSNIASSNLTADELIADGATTSVESIGTTASSVGAVTNQVSITITPIDTGRFYFSVGGTATTLGAWISQSAPLVISNYSGSVSLIRASGSGDVQVDTLTRST